MFGHFPELIIILALGLIVFGPEKLPEVAANAGKMVREFRDILDGVMNPHDTQVPEDFSQYYYESLSRAGEAPDDADASFDLDSEGLDDLGSDDDLDSEASELDATAEAEDWQTLPASEYTSAESTPETETTPPRPV